MSKDDCIKFILFIVDEVNKNPLTDGSFCTAYGKDFIEISHYTTNSSRDWRLIKSGHESIFKEMVYEIGVFGLLRSYNEQKAPGI